MIGSIRRWSTTCTVVCGVLCKEQGHFCLESRSFALRVSPSSVPCEHCLNVFSSCGTPRPLTNTWSCSTALYPSPSPLRRKNPDASFLTTASSPNRIDDRVTFAVAFIPANAYESSSGQHRQRTSRTSNVPTITQTSPNPSLRASSPQGLGIALAEGDEVAPMSLDRSPSPHPGGGWSSPGLALPSDRSPLSRGGSPGKRYGELNGDYRSSWASAKEKSARVKGYPRHQSSNQGFFTRHLRNISESLPRLTSGEYSSRYADKEKLGRGRSSGLSWYDLPRRLALLLSRRRKLVALFMLLLLVLLVITSKPLRSRYRRHPWFGGGSKYVIILGANVGGGVMEWKGAREWAIERDSLRNKKSYAAEWGYEIEIVDMATKKRYAHEWRESWEKVDTMRNAMKKYPNAEWFWCLDLNTFIMEPSISLQQHIFNRLGQVAYRDINIYNPLKISHPPNGTSDDPNAPQYVNYLDPEATSAVGDGDPESINLLVPQDCGGFNLGSWFMKRSDWSERLLDIWWDPVFYEQKHMDWEHKEQDALEYLYTNQPWVRPHVGFLPQRMINAFPPAACGDDRGIPPGGCSKAKPGEKNECGVQGIHYQEKERDFLVNMAGCEWGRDCWGEMYNYRQKSRWLNRSRWERFKDGISDIFKSEKQEKKQ